MADISTYLNNISTARYGRDVRSSIHDAIDIINKVGEKVMTIGTAVTSSSSSVTGYYAESLYLNSETGILWKCTGSAWAQLGNFRGPAGQNGSNGTNGADGVSLTATSSKTGKVTTVLIKNASTGATLTTLTINDGTDGEGAGDMTKAEYASSTSGVVKKAVAATSADSSTIADKLRCGNITFRTTEGTDSTVGSYLKKQSDGSWAAATADDSLDNSSIRPISNKAVADALDEKIANPSTKSANQVLTWNGSAWVAADASGGAEINDNTTSSSKVWSSTKTNNMIDSWHTYQNAKEEVTVSSAGEATIVFHDIRADYAYRLMADTTDGSLITVKSSSFTQTGALTGGGTSIATGTLTYVVNVTTVPAVFALRKSPV